jgi:5-methylcytosine-specific restriction endonuclease McrA
MDQSNSPTPFGADYPPEWYSGDIQARIRELAHYTCEICGQVFDPVTNKMWAASDDDSPIFGHVHHLDHCPPNCADSNLIFLCQNCHIRLHGLGWKPGDEMPISWNNEAPPWVLRRNLAYQLNPAVSSLHEAARYLTDKQECARFIIQIIEQQGWIKGFYDAQAEMRGFLKTVLQEYDLILDERTRQAQGPIRAQAQAWAETQGLIAYPEAVGCSGLSEADFATAMEQGLIAAETCPYVDSAVPAYFHPDRVVLSPETIQAMWAKMRLTRQQAADCLGVSVSIFERLRRKAGFKPVESVRGSDGRYEPLYRRRDVEALRKG